MSHRPVVSHDHCQIRSQYRTDEGTSYRVITVEARGEKDPDIYLVINYKNWAAFDGATAKADAIAKQVEGTLEKSNQGADVWGPEVMG
jgi:hypothetical protein